jgi:RND family efflux transporter MFP subunit
MKSFPLSIAAFALFALGCVDREAQVQAKQTENLIKDPTIAVTVMDIAPTSVEDTLDITGTIETSDDVSVTAIVGGPLIAVYVKDGDQVRAGQAIAKQDASDYQARVTGARAQANAARSALDQARADAEIGPVRSTAAVKAAEARLSQAQSRLQRLINGARPEERAQAEAQVNKAKSDLDTAKLALDRAKRLFTEGAIPKAALEQAENAYASALAAYDSALQNLRLVQNASREEDISAARQDVAAAQQQLAIDQANKRLDVLYEHRVESAQANLQSAQQNLRLAEIALDNTTLRAPFSGRLSGKPLQAGTYVSPGVEVARIVGTGGAYFEAEIPESQIALVQPGMSVEVSVDALSGAKAAGTLIAINPQATGAGRLFFGRVRLDSVPAGLRAGMFARGVAVLGRRDGVFLVPSEAVLKDGDKSYVFIAVGEKAQRRDVTIGVTRNGSTEVIGIGEGDQIIVKGQGTLTDGSTIKLQDRTEPKENGE